VDISEVVQVGENVLEIDVVTPWHNRLVGDANLPAERRTTYLRAPSAVPANSALKPAGLIGPVTIGAAVTAE
jgi:(4-O-methyl)-D-glucuronate---lignin esterase